MTSGSAFQAERVRMHDRQIWFVGEAVRSRWKLESADRRPERDRLVPTGIRQVLRRVATK